MKTLALRLTDDEHARTLLLSQLTGESANEIIRTLINGRLETMATDPELSAKADELQAAIQADAVEQAAAIAELFAGNTNTVTDPEEQPDPATLDIGDSDDASSEQVDEPLDPQPAKRSPSRSRGRSAT